METTILANLQKAESDLNMLKGKKTLIEEKIKNKEKTVQEYKTILNQKKFLETENFLKTHNLTIEEILKRVANGEITSFTNNVDNPYI